MHGSGCINVRFYYGSGFVNVRFCYGPGLGSVFCGQFPTVDSPVSD